MEGESTYIIYKGKIISPLTVKQYKTTLNKLKSFESTENLKIKFEDIKNENNSAEKELEEYFNVTVE